MSITAAVSLALVFLSCPSVLPSYGTALSQDPLLRVRVLDPEGEPARGVEVLKSWRPVQGQGGCVQFRSDERGEVSIPITQEDFRSAEQGTSYELIAQGAFGVANRRPFNPRSSASALIELRVSMSTGRLGFRVQDEQGQIVLEPLRISYWCVGRTEEDGTGCEPMSSVRILELNTGLGESEPVAVGCRWRIKVESRDRSRDTGFTEIEGPRRAGEALACVVSPGAELPTVILKLRDPEGRPISQRIWRLEIRTSNGTIVHPSVPSDESGILRVVLQLGVRDIVVDGLGLFASSEMGTWSAEHALGGRRIDRHVDLGVIVCKTPQSVVCGVVVDGAGAPLAQAQIGVYDQAQLGTAEPDHAPLARAITDELGRFDIRVSDAVRSVAIHAKHQDHLDLLEREIEIRDPRSRDLRLVMRRTGWIEGRLIVDRMEDLSRWRLVLEDSEGTLCVIASHFLDERFTLHRLDPAKRYALHCGVLAPSVGPDEHAPGMKRLSLRTTRDLDVALSLHDLRLPAQGGACADPRLQQLDLRGLRALRSATFRSAKNRILADENVTIVQREATAVTRSIPQRTDSHGRCTWLGRRAGIELFAYAEGHALARLDAAAEQQVVQLIPRSLEVEVRLEHRDDRNRKGRQALHLLALPKQLSPIWVAAINWRMLEADAHLEAGRARFSLPAPGRYELLLMHCNGGTSLQCPRMYPMSFCGEIEVIERDGVQSFRAVEQGLRY